MAGCKACGGVDHQRRNSTKCSKYLPPIRKRNLDAGSVENLQVYVVKKGLCSTLCPLLTGDQRARILEEIRRDARDLSRIYIKLGIFYNAYVKIWGLPAKPDVLQFVYAMKGKGPYAAAYTQLFGSAEKYDGKLRSFIIQELAKDPTNFDQFLCVYQQ